MKTITLLILILLITSPLRGYAETTNTEIDLSVNPHDILFDLSNVKPGDSISRILTVSNNGNSDFNYITSSKFLSGSKKFYEELLLRIEDGNKVLYEGKLHEFNKLDARLLQSQVKEELLFYIEIPYELGNEFQRLTSQFQIKLFVEGTIGGLLPVNGPKLPTTATNMFNFVLGGLLLLSGGTFLYFVKIKRKAELYKKNI